jgi:hypothetical protein
MTLHACRPGDRVTIRTSCGLHVTGRVVIARPHSLTLNCGGRHGRPQVATEANIVRVQPAKAAA